MCNVNVFHIRQSHAFVCHAHLQGDEAEFHMAGVTRQTHSECFLCQQTQNGAVYVKQRMNVCKSYRWPFSKTRLKIFDDVGLCLSQRLWENCLQFMAS